MVCLQLLQCSCTDLFQRRSFQVVCGNIDSIMLGMPGNALSDTSLTDADMPHVKEMVNDSLESCCIFKRQAEVPEPAPKPPFPHPDAEDPVQDFDPGNVHSMLVCIRAQQDPVCSACSRADQILLCPSPGCMQPQTVIIHISITCNVLEANKRPTD